MVKVFQTPQHVFYERGAINVLGEQAQRLGKKALIVSDQIMNSLGYVALCERLLKKHEIESVIFLGVETEPTDIFVAQALKLLKAEACEFIISIGGGSCIDTAKAVALIATNGNYIGNYMNDKIIAQKEGLPHIAIPTTAGTGSEATDVTVITNSTNHVKMMIKQATLMPKIAIVDAELTKSSPESVTAATGVDALCHAIEAYISKKAQPMTDILALSAMRLIVQNIETAYDDGTNIVARENMALAALQAGMAFSNASVCLVHGMSRPIGAMFNVPHGYSNAMLLPAILEYSKAECVGRLADLGRIFVNDDNLDIQEAAQIAVNSVKTLCKNLNIPNLQEWGIDEIEFTKALNKMADDALNSGSPMNNPKVPTKEEIIKLYKYCYSYQV